MDKHLAFFIFSKNNFLFSISFDSLHEWSKDQAVRSIVEMKKIFLKKTWTKIKLAFFSSAHHCFKARGRELPCSNFVAIIALHRSLFVIVYSHSLSVIIVIPIGCRSSSSVLVRRCLLPSVVHCSLFVTIFFFNIIAICRHCHWRPPPSPLTFINITVIVICCLLSSLFVAIVVRCRCCLSPSLSITIVVVVTICHHCRRRRCLSSLSLSFVTIVVAMVVWRAPKSLVEPT